MNASHTWLARLVCVALAGTACAPGNAAAHHLEEQVSDPVPGATQADGSGIDLQLARADRLQAAHRFDEAERVLDEVLARQPGNPQAHLMRSQVRIARGRPRGALADCVAASGRLDALAASACVAQAQAALGDAVGARQLVERALAEATESSPTRGWAAGIAAEFAERACDRAAADRWHRLAIADSGDAHFPDHAYREFRARFGTGCPTVARNDTGDSLGP
jgi:predicted Zn-dependent protease